MLCSSSPAMGRYNRRVLAWMMLYAALLCGAIWATQKAGLVGPTRYAVAALPALPIIAVFITIGRYLIEETDEYQRHRMVRQTLYATAFALSLTTLWGFLESLADAPHIPAYYVAIIWFAGQGLGALLLRIQDR